MKNLGTIGLTVLTVLMFALLISGCGDDGVDGITGTSGCDFDQVKDPATGFCVHDDTDHITNHPANGVDGKDGVDGQDGADGDVCDQGRVFNGINGKCEAP